MADVEPHPAVRELFHRLNNQFGVILAHAELIEARTTDETSRSRAAQIVSKLLAARETVTELRGLVQPPEA